MKCNNSATIDEYMMRTPFLKQRLSNKEFSLSGSRGTGRGHKSWYTMNDAIKLTCTVCIWIMPLTFDVIKGK